MHAALGWWARSLAAMAVAVFAAMASAAGAAPLPPIEQFTRPPTISDVAMSPAGTRLAMIFVGVDGRQRVAVMDLDPIGKPRVVAGFADADVKSVRWVNDERLVYEAYQRRAEVERGGAGTFAVNHDGSNMRQLIAWISSHYDITNSVVPPKLLPYGWFLRSTIDDGTDDVFVYKYVHDTSGEFKDVQLARLNTSTGALHNLSYGMPEGARGWLVDSKYEPRMVTAEVAGRTKIYWRGAGENAWREVADFDAYAEPGFAPWEIDADGQVFVLSRQLGDTQALYKFDPKQKRIDPEPVLRLDGFDLRPSREVDDKTRRLVGLHFESDRPQSYWFDADLRRIQRGVDAALPAGNSNRLYCGRCESTRFIVVRSSSDRQPGRYFLFDRGNSSLQAIGDSRPWIDEATQGRRSFQRVAARDGLPIPVYVTQPAGAVDPAHPPAAIMLVHGGPWVRGGHITWEAEAQFLASRGYVVLEPDFRGSEGYGWHHFQESWKQWGRAMQDDLVDTVKWAAKQGLIDPARVCIMGASYGGYAALMGVIADPGVYRCAVSLAGVTDIDLMYSVTWSDFGEEYKRYGMPVLIGDREKDAAALLRASPLQRAAEIKVPVLLIHGGVDRRVPIVHASKFAAAARAGGVAIEVLTYPDEGHGFVDPVDHADYLAHVEKFLAKSLQAAPH